MLNKIGNLLATLLGGALLVYSASRSLDFITLTLPADKQILAWFGLAALDGGIVAWLLAYLYGSEGGWQRSIGFIMVVVDFLGAVAMFTLDTLYNAGKSGMIASMSESEIQTAVLALSLVIALNIASTIAHHMLDPNMLRKQAEEEARAQIEDQALALIRENSRQLAAEVAPQIASTWRQQTQLEYAHRLKKPRESRQLPAQLPVFESDVEQVNPTKRRSSRKS